MIGFDIKGSRGMRVRKNRSRDSVAQEFGDNLFHWSCSKSSVKAISDEKLDGVGVYIEIIKAFLAEELQLFLNG